jgi:tetratricopeptide (TPR) repeat protein
MTRSNESLAAGMREAGLSNKALARMVREISIRRGDPVMCDHTSVTRWLAGGNPRGATPIYIATAVGAKLGRPIPPTELGFAEPAISDPSLGTTYGKRPDDAVGSLASLWRADLEDTRAIVAAPTNSGAWADASLSWLVRADVDEIRERPAGARVGASDVLAVRTTAEAFALLDNNFGGGHARRALIQYLRSDVATLLAGRYTEQIGRDLYGAAAEATLLGAWMTYDAGIHGLAQRYFIQALRLAQAANDPVLGSSILDAMSHQATFLGRSHEATNLARAARNGGKGYATATLNAHFLAMEARALASAGDAAGADRALSEAVSAFERRAAGEDPDWISYFDDAELSAEFSHCLRDMGRPDEAITYGQRALSGSSARSDFFVSVVLATSYLNRHQSEPEEACRIVGEVLAASGGIKSARCADYLRRFRRQLAPFENLPVVQELSEMSATSPVWIASDSRA